MKMQNQTLLLFCFIILPSAFCLRASGQTTAFTYQGQLTYGSAPANGTYDFRFQLYDTNAPGDPTALVAGPVTNSAIAVSNGLFTTTIDFGAGIFDGSTNLWLQIGVHTNGVTGWVALSPRQQITPTPYAEFAANVSGISIQQNSGGAPNVILGSSANFVSNGVVGATIGGGGATNYNGYSNSVTSDFGTVSGGSGNIASGDSATVGGGLQNSASGEKAAVSGGNYNDAIGVASFIGGGIGNGAAGAYSTVGGGADCNASGDQSTVTGGESNDAIGTWASVGGGQYCNADGKYATVGGGGNDYAPGSEATVSGGRFNGAVGDAATVSGGYGNEATNDYATVPGGYENIAGGEYSFAAGQKAQATNDGAFVWADSQNTNFSSTANDQFLIRAGGGVGINTASPQNDLSVNGGMNIDQAGLNAGYVRTNGLTFGNHSGEGIGSVRVSGRADSFGLNFYTSDAKRITILQNGNVGVGTTNPAYLFVVGSSVSPAYCTGTTWQNGSDRNIKHNFDAINPQEVLKKVSTLPITEWQYKTETAGTEHIGPMAQDFHAAFGLNGADDKHISTVDEGGVALAAIQGLDEKVNEKDAEIQDLKQRLDRLEKIILKQKTH